MARKIFPIFDKVSNLLKLSFLKHKLRKPITIPKLLLLKKSKKLKEFKLLRHHHHQKFSPSSSSIRNHFKNTRHRDLRSFFYLYWCLGNFKIKGAGGTGTEEYKVEAMPMRPIENEDGVVAVVEDLFDSGDELGESVDEKAERFINRFYHEMRMQNRGMDLYI